MVTLRGRLFFLTTTFTSLSSPSVTITASAFSPGYSPIALAVLRETATVTKQSFRKMATHNDNVGLTDIGTSPTQSSSLSPNEEEESITLTTWREKINVSIARSRKVRGGNYVQIATVDPKTMEPRCRTVVFRGFLKSTGAAVTGTDNNDKNQSSSSIMKMITDKRSSKYAEVMDHDDDNDENNQHSHKSTAEMVWWFGKSSEQYRIRGQLKFVGKEETNPSLVIARKEQWGNMSDPAREQFYWKKPGIPFDSQANVPQGGRGEDGKVLPPPENFLLMLLYPSRCDYLRLGDNFRQIDDLVDEDGTWTPQRVTP